MEYSKSKVNLDYQSALSPLGGSYTENKFHRLNLPDLSGRSFLDLGCNAGYYCDYALRSGALRVVGVDLDKNVIAKAKLQLPRVEFHDGGWDNDFPAGPFDVVILLSAIHYAADPLAVIAKVHSEMQHGALLILEGGLIDPHGIQQSDCLVPGWRQVGDRCRHLSYGYLRNHLLVDFDWRVIGDSEPRSGDNVARYVVHAFKTYTPRTRTSHHTLDLLDYAAGIALSSETIVDSQPASAYLRTWCGSSRKDHSLILAQILGQPHLFELFLTDLAYALEPSKMIPIRIIPNLSSELLDPICTGLLAHGFAISTHL